MFAVGDGINQPLGIIALPVGELPTRTPVDNRSNGLWTLADASGYGFVLQPMPSQNRLVGKWYQPDENGNPTYFFFDSCLDDTNDEGEFECSTPGAFDGEMATTALYQCVGGSLDMSEMVECTDIGQIDFEILGCNDANATVRLGDDTVGTVYAAKQLTRPFPCVDPEPAAQ